MPSNFLGISSTIYYIMFKGKLGDYPNKISHGVVTRRPSNEYHMIGMPYSIPTIKKDIWPYSSTKN